MKKSSIVLIVLSVLVLCVSIFIIMTYKGSEGSTTTLLKDMGSDELRVVGDKTDVYNNQEGSFLIKGEKPDNYLEPEDVSFGNTDVTQGKEDLEGNSDNNSTVIRDSVFVGNPNKSELQEYAPGEHITIIDEILQPSKEKPKKDRISYEEAMVILQNYLNSEDNYVYGSFLLTSYYNTFAELSELAGVNGAIIIPFAVGNQKQIDNIKSWVSIYEQYKNDISFIFLNTDLELAGFKVLEDIFYKNGISLDLPIYTNEFGDILGFIANGDISNQGYIILDRAFYIVAQGTISEGKPNLKSIFSDLDKRDNGYKELEDLVTEKYNEGWIITYSDVKKAIDGTLTAPETDNETETDIENNVTE